VNLLLVDAGELAADGSCVLTDRRAQHVREVLGASVGSMLRAGLVGGGTGTATVTADDGAALTIHLEVTAPPAPVWPVELVLAVPRPKVLTRVIEAAASFGVARIALTNAWRVDKSYLDSPRLLPDALAHAARLGAEQGATTHVPPIELHRRFMAMIASLPDGRRAAPPEAVRRSIASLPDGSRAAPPEAVRRSIASLPDGRRAAPPEAARRLIARDWPGPRFVAHPGAPPLAEVAALPCVLAVGPEGGWIERELDTFVARGFTPVSLGPPILRVETAVAALLGQLLALTGSDTSRRARDR
jgi:16S rRNA U1498 N3-methylase RsmE